MKTTVFGMMIAAMMMAGTTTGFAKNNVHAAGNHTTVVVVNKCSHCDKHVTEHRHVLDKRHMDCKLCHVKLDRYGRPLVNVDKHTVAAPVHTPAPAHNVPAAGQKHFKK